MEDDASRAVAEILGANDDFLAEVGRLTLLFSVIEDRLVHDGLALLRVVDYDDKDVVQNAASKLTQPRILEKRDFLKRTCAEIGRFYQVDDTGVAKILDELGNINRLRRTVVHGWIRWCAANEKPVFIDSRGHSTSAWPADVLDLNIKINNWLGEYLSEQASLMRAVLCAYDTFADNLLRHPKLPASIQPLLKELKAKVAALATE